MVETYDATAGTWSLYAYSTLKVEGEQVYTAASTYQLIAAKILKPYPSKFLIPMVML